MARLPHPNIVGVYDIVQNETINYIAMEFLDGGTLADQLRDGLTLAEAMRAESARHTISVRRSRRWV